MKIWNIDCGGLWDIITCPEFDILAKVIISKFFSLILYHPFHSHCLMLRILIYWHYFNEYICDMEFITDSNKYRKSRSWLEIENYLNEIKYFWWKVRKWHKIRIIVSNSEIDCIFCSSSTFFIIIMIIIEKLNIHTGDIWLNIVVYLTYSAT